LNESSTNPGAQTSGSPDSSLNDVRNRLDRTGFSFLSSDAELALTLARIAQDADTDSEKRARNRNNARRAYDTITSLMSRVTLTGEEEQELTGKLSQLKSELRLLGERFSTRNHR
jgi:phosphoenolpyruvate carboxylase